MASIRANGDYFITACLLCIPLGTPTHITGYRHRLVWARAGDGNEEVAIAIHLMRERHRTYAARYGDGDAGKLLDIKVGRTWHTSRNAVAKLRKRHFAELCDACKRRREAEAQDRGLEGLLAESIRQAEERTKRQQYWRERQRVHREKVVAAAKAHANKSGRQE